MAVRFLPVADADLLAASRYIASHNPQAARRWVLRVRERCAKLGEMPGLGAPRFDVLPGLRLLPVGTYLVLYREAGADVEVLRVVHGARQWQRLL